MKLWVDDLRPAPNDDWVWCKTSAHALAVMNYQLLVAKRPPEEMSLDHDLGGDDTTRPVVLWMCQNSFWPPVVRVHSFNPVGREWLSGMIERYKP